jgi:oleandomycin transport system ATP-binding protein
VTRLAAEHIAVTELALRLPSLDEAFFALTGHRTTADDDETTQDETTQDETTKKDAA